MTIMGVDPGTRITGYGIISIADDGAMKYIACGAIIPKEKTLPEKLLKIFNELCAVIKKYKPCSIAVEEVFFAKNVRSTVMIGEARSAALIAAARAGVPVANYPPAEVKKTVAGNGMAEKKQVQLMVKLHLRLNELPEPIDASDALAIAICHGFLRNLP
ncbi:MAG: crossover junction endodeoxyribonuclease RuvC [Planctomycetes bacterium]|nr:crossover junction endodeoxyribonuclease RuvC [Planctomycetota bacterium]